MYDRQAPYSKLRCIAGYELAKLFFVSKFSMTKMNIDLVGYKYMAFKSFNKNYVFNKNHLNTGLDFNDFVVNLVVILGC